jgi:hypothetical protein
VFVTFVAKSKAVEAQLVLDKMMRDMRVYHQTKNVLPPSTNVMPGTAACTSPTGKTPITSKSDWVADPAGPRSSSTSANRATTSTAGPSSARPKARRGRPQLRRCTRLAGHRCLDLDRQRARDGVHQHQRLTPMSALSEVARQHERHRYREMQFGSARSETPCAYGTSLHENRENSGTPAAMVRWAASERPRP